MSGDHPEGGAKCTKSAHFSAVGLLVLAAFTSSYVSAQTVNGTLHGTVANLIAW
jgi:hypothetical protein